LTEGRLKILEQKKKLCDNKEIGRKEGKREIEREKKEKKIS